MLRVLPILVLLVFFVQDVEGQECLIWNGFSIDWTYNHRVNRLGSYVQGQEVYTTGATGLGRDSCRFETFYSTLEAELKTQEVKKRIVLIGEEHERINKRLMVSFPLTGEDNKIYKAVLNGFDLLSVGKADKLHDLTVRIADQHLSADSNRWELSVDVSLLVNCTTPECEIFNQEVHYQLDLFFLLLELDADTPLEAIYPSHRFDWFDEDKRVRNALFLQTRKGYNQAAIQGFEIALDRDHWIVATELSAQYKKADHFEIALEYWANFWNMKKDSYHRPHSRFSKGIEGEAKVAIDLLLMVLPGKVTPDSFVGSIIWPGKNISAAGDEAVMFKKIR